MNALINELKKDHEQLLKILQETQDLGLVTDAGRKKLLEGKKLLADHLMKEDIKLYPVLAKSGSAVTANEFAVEMKGLTSSILNFINRLETSKNDMEYAKELGRIVSTLKMRIRREEIQLYPLYEKMSA
ncbi:MAG: hemerythrin domain-containing protein [Deferribacterales bacterium]